MVRFDDSLETVLASDLSSEGAQASVWRQLVDLIGRGRAAPDPRAIALLASLVDRVPRTVRMASARAIEHAAPPLALVELLAGDAIEVAMPVLRGATLTTDEWRALLPRLGPVARGVVRNRRDLNDAVVRLLDGFGPVDLVLPDGREPIEEQVPIVLPAAAPARRRVADALADIAPGPATPLFAPFDPAAEPVPSGPFSIVDVMARIEAFERNHEPAPAALPPVARRDTFRFETDATGAIRWVEGVGRGAVVGLSLALAGSGAHAGFDGVAAGALRRRTAFHDARLTIAGDSDAGGEWRASAVPAFDPGSGRFTGYRGTARRPRRDECAEPVAAPAPATGVAQLRQLVHELRTPAGAITGFAEMIESQLLGPVAPVYRERAAAILAHSRELVAVIDDLDLAARIDGQALDLRADRVALQGLFDTIAADLASLCALRGAALALPATDVVVAGDRRAVERLLARLLATLLSAGAAGETIAVQVAAEDAATVALRIDRPAALAPWPGERVFDVDDGEDDAAPLGTGFALRLARNLAGELGGALRIDATALTLRLPLAEAAEAERVVRQ